MAGSYANSRGDGGSRTADGTRGGGTGADYQSALPKAASAESDELQPVATSEAEWRDRLTPEQYAVLRRAGTEPPFSGEYVDTDENGLYRCGACGNPLFSSETKFHSGSGWPSFTEAVSPDAVELLEDRAHGMRRTEVRCARCHSHLGHLFDDGPRDAGGQRFCMNSLALEMEPR